MSFLVIPLMGFRVEGKRLALPVDIPHSGAGPPSLPAVNTFGVFTARHFESRWRSLKNHRPSTAESGGCAWSPPSSKQIGRSPEECGGSSPPFQCQFKSGVLGPDRMFGPHPGCVGMSRFISIAMASSRGTGIHAEMGMGIDEARGYDSPCQVNDLCPLRCGFGRG